MAAKPTGGKKPQDLWHTVRTLLAYMGRHKFLLLAVAVLVTISALANLLGSTMIDVVFGTLATFLACLCTYAVRHARVGGLAIPAALPPILWNAVIVGTEIAVFFSDTPATPALILANALSVGAGEVISCGVLGVALVRLIERNPRLRQAFTDEGVRTA